MTFKFTPEEIEWILSDEPCPASDEIRKLEDERIIKEIILKVLNENSTDL